VYICFLKNTKFYEKILFTASQSIIIKPRPNISPWWDCKGKTIYLSYHFELDSSRVYIISTIINQLYRYDITQTRWKRYYKYIDIILYYIKTACRVYMCNTTNTAENLIKILSSNTSGTNYIHYNPLNNTISRNFRRKLIYPRLPNISPIITLVL